MKIISWNINSLRLRIELLRIISEKLSPDIIALQETKVEDKDFPHEKIYDMGYKHIYFSGQKSYNGVAILSKIKCDDVFTLDFVNDHKRHIAVRIKDVEIHNFYVPAGGDIADPEINDKFKHKLEYISSIENWFLNNHSINSKIILLGDLNIAPYEHDVWSSKQLKNTVSHTDVERELLINFKNSCNFLDIARKFTPIQEKSYSWWSYRNKDWKKSNRGRRLDHIWVSSILEKTLVGYGSLIELRDFEKCSDHIPIFADFSNELNLH